MKIDRSFVLGMAEDDDDAAIVRSTIDLARHLRLEVVAEGVETEEVADGLRELRCDIAQGYHFSRPLPVDSLREWLDHHERRHHRRLTAPVRGQHIVVADDETAITPYRDGPLLVRGPFRLIDQDGEEIDVGRRTVALCRCGKSRIRPFCDGTHKLVRFDAPSGAESR